MNEIINLRLYLNYKYNCFIIIIESKLNMSTISTKASISTAASFTLPDTMVK